MRKCLHCDVNFTSLGECCSHCGTSLSENIEGFEAYAPAHAYNNEGFQSDFFATLSSIEKQHFWFRARNRLIIWALRKYDPDFQSFLEIGCGTGNILSAIAEAFPNRHLQGSELFIEGLHFAAQRLPKTHFMQMDARAIPFFQEFDCIGAFDVLEHIKQDEQVLNQIYQALKPQGITLITVPQHRWLWSPVDELAKHVRRYSAKDLHNKFQAAGFQILHSTSFVSALLPMMFLSRLQQQYSRKPCTAESELRIRPVINTLFEKILNVEIALIQKGLRFSVGGSRLVIAKKID